MSNDSIHLLKRCTKCSQEFPATNEYFSLHKQGTNCLRAQCKICERNYTKQYKIQHPDKVIQWDKKFRATHVEKLKNDAKKRYLKNRTKVIKAATQWQKDNPDRVKVSRAGYRSRHKVQIRQTKRDYYRSNPTQSIAKCARYRARKRNALGTYTSTDILKQLKRQRNQCYWCNCTLDNTYHVDHVVPLARGGSNFPENIVIACPHCNQSRGAKLPSEWPEGGRLL